MTSMTKKFTGFGRRIRGLALALSVAAVAGGAMAAPALADEWNHGRDFRVERDWRAHERFEHRRFVAAPYAYRPYAYHYAAPPVYAAPPSLNLVVPLTIR